MEILDTIFKEDEARTVLAQHNFLEKLKNTYSRKTNIHNPNSPKFWDAKLATQSVVDPMARDRLINATKLIPKHTVNLLDIGVGNGFFLKQVKKTRPEIEIVGIDISLDGLLSLRNHLKSKLIAGSILSIPIKKKFNIVTVFEVLEHLQYYRVFRAFKEIKKVMNKKGTLLVSVPINEHYSSEYNPNGHLRRYSKQLFLAELKLADFRIIKIEEFYAFSSLYTLKKFIAKYILIHKWQPNVILIEAKLR